MAYGTGKYGAGKYSFSGAPSVVTPIPPWRLAIIEKHQKLFAVAAHAREPVIQVPSREDIFTILRG